MNIDHFLPLILNVGKAEMHSDWNFENVSSPFARIYYVTDGKASISIGNKVHDLKVGHLYLIPPYVRHSNYCHGSFTHYYMHVLEDDNYNHGSLFDEYDFPFEVESEQMDILLFDRLIDMNPTMRLMDYAPDTYDTTMSTMNAMLQNKKRDIDLRVESRGIVYQLFSRFLRNATSKVSPMDDRIRTCAEYINEHLNAELRIEMLAEKACMSQNHFIRKFKSEMGLTPIQYINKRKVEKAQYHLFVGGKTVKEIAYALGFYETSNFYRLFRQIAGVTPLEYQKKTHSNS